MKKILVTQLPIPPYEEYIEARFGHVGIISYGEWIHGIGNENTGA